MSASLGRVHDCARILLACIRLFNGAAALFVPAIVARRLKDDSNSAIIYVLRLFGMRTIIMGIELLVLDKKLKTRFSRSVILVHASDTLAAALAGIQKQLPARVSLLLTALSGFNTILAILAQPRED